MTPVGRACGGQVGLGMAPADRGLTEARKIRQEKFRRRTHLGQAGQEPARNGTHANPKVTMTKATTESPRR